MEFLKNLRKLTAVLFILCFALGCSEPSSDSSGDYYDDYGNYNSSSTNGKACSSFKPIPGAYDGSYRHVYIGEFRLDKGSSQQSTYRQFMADFGLFCKVNDNGFKWIYNQNTQRWVYSYQWSRGVANCSEWDDFFKLWIIFPRNDARRAHLVIDSTMSGYPDGRFGQGYDLQRIQLPDAQIDCREQDEIDIYFEPNLNSQFRVRIYQGTKNSEHLRAQVYYKKSSIGKTDFFIVQN